MFRLPNNCSKSRKKLIILFQQIVEGDVHEHGADERQHVHGGVLRPRAAGGVRSDEPDQRDDDAPVQLPGPHRAVAQLPVEEQHDDEQRRDERGGVAEEERRQPRRVPLPHDRLAGAVAGDAVRPEPSRRAQPGHVREARGERGEQQEHLARPLLG
ncbi:Os06g0294300, partial [Oryza sativa Japonica Group]